MDFSSPSCTEGFQLGQITCPDQKTKSFDLNINTSNRGYITMLSNRTPCIPYINDT